LNGITALPVQWKEWEFCSEGVIALPLYAYRCTQCGHLFEKIQNFSAEPEKVCPKCGGALERPPTAPRLQFKGAGWYVNDYASKSSAPASESGSESTVKSDGGSAGTESAKPSTAGESKAATPASAPAASSPASPSSTTGSSS
jgi:putative FmdB family regulatory protein